MVPVVLLVYRCVSFFGRVLLLQPQSIREKPSLANRADPTSIYTPSTLRDQAETPHLARPGTGSYPLDDRRRCLPPASASCTAALDLIVGSLAVTVAVFQLLRRTVFFPLRYHVTFLLLSA